MADPLDGTREEIATYLLHLKEERRRELAALPIEEKIHILVEMQKRANAIRRSAGRPERPVWEIGSA